MFNNVDKKLDYYWINIGDNQVIGAGIFSNIICEKKDVYKWFKENSFNKNIKRKKNKKWG